MGSPSLASEMDQLAEHLGMAAERSGLAVARPRSSPDRRRWESAEFIAALACALDVPVRRLGPAARRLMRTGPLAACRPDEVGPFFALWTTVLREQLARSPREVERVSTTLQHLEQRVLADLPRWQADRVDVVALGASAGGITALSEVLKQLTVSFPATLLVVLHVSDDNPGVLPQVLGRATRLPIATAAQDGRLLLGNISVAPPGRHLTIVGDRTRLIETPPERYSRPSIDVLFRSAAEARKKSLACVLLSGSGRDGTSGCEAVRAAGGITLAQLPSTAAFSNMPEEAIAQGVVQRTGSPAVLGRLLGRLVTSGRRACRL